MSILNCHLAWFKLKCPYAVNTPEYKMAYSKLNNASHFDIVQLGAEFSAYETDNFNLTKHYYVNGEWVATVARYNKGKAASNMKGIQRHGHKWRVQQRSRNKIRKWTFDTKKEAVAKRDAIFA